MRRVVSLFRPYRLRLASVLGLILVAAALDIISPFLLRAVLDQAIPERDNALLTALASCGPTSGLASRSAGSRSCAESARTSANHDCPSGPLRSS